VLAVRVRSQDGGGDPLAALQTWLKGELAQYKWPGGIIERTEFPRAGNRKYRSTRHLG
jgi:hypothetical protein